MHAKVNHCNLHVHPITPSYFFLIIDQASWQEVILYLDWLIWRRQWMIILLIDLYLCEMQIWKPTWSFMECLMRVWESFFVKKILEARIHYLWKELLVNSLVYPWSPNWFPRLFFYTVWLKIKWQTQLREGKI